MLESIAVITVGSRIMLLVMAAESQAWMTLELFQKSVNQSAALSACYALGMESGANAVPLPKGS